MPRVNWYPTDQHTHSTFASHHHHHRKTYTANQKVNTLSPGILCENDVGDAANNDDDDEDVSGFFFREFSHSVNNISNWMGVSLGLTGKYSKSASSRSSRYPSQRVVMYYAMMYSALYLNCARDIASSVENDRLRITWPSYRAGLYKGLAILYILPFMSYNF